MTIGRIGVDTGGTFTDFVFVRDGRVSLAKVPTRPGDPAAAVADGLARLAAQTELSDAALTYGTTVATNALLERRLARVTFVTNEGLEDVLEIGRQARPELFALEPAKPEPLVPRERRLGVRQRAEPDGSIRMRLTTSEIRRIVRRVKRTRPEAIAVGLLYAFLDATDERRLARALATLGVPVSTSADVAPEVREFERFATTVANAALLPLVARALERLERSLQGRKLFVFQSNGGMTTASGAAARPVRLVLSGPAGGALAAARIAERQRLTAALAIDMGGTSTDVTWIQGRRGPRGGLGRRAETAFAGQPLLVPALAIDSVGAGGGSIAWRDSAGLLRVGPRSAGADPGPACYGKSDLATVTDAHVVLGRLPASLAGGAVVLDREAAHRALDRLGRRIGRDRFATAEGVLAVADAAMARAARRVAIDQGADPRGATLIAFGGAGPLHAARLVTALDAQAALVPAYPGNFSALGMALADEEHDVARTVLTRDPDRDPAGLARRIRELARRGLGEMRAAGLGGIDVVPRVSTTLECRYVGQTATVPVADGPRVRARFDRAHRERFGHAFPEREVELVTIRVRLTVPSRRRLPSFAAAGHRGGARAARTGERRARFAGRWTMAPCFARELVPPSARILGPAIVEEFGATTVVEPGFLLRVTPTGELSLTRSRA